MKSKKSLWYAVKSFLVEAQNRITRKVVLLGIQKTNEPDLIRLGSYYGGWWVPIESLSPKFDHKVCISAGIGGDITFDRELLEVGYRVIALDPLELCVLFANETLSNYSKFTAVPAGLWNETGTQRFFAPKNSEHDAWSVTNSQATSIEESQSFPVITIQDVLCEYPEVSISEYSILKMDIEGAELEVLRNLNTIEYRFDWLAVEIDYLSLIPFLSLKRRILAIHAMRTILKDLESTGYVFSLNERYNFFFDGRGSQHSFVH